MFAPCAKTSAWAPAPPEIAMQTPDYRGGSIVNLMASIMAARGGSSAYPALRLLPPDEIAGVTNLILLVIDGLGSDYLARHCASLLPWFKVSRTRAADCKSASASSLNWVSR